MLPQDTSTANAATPATATTVMRPRISVLLCNYNHARFLPESLGGICTQTLLPDEVIVVDDGSTDDSLTVIRDFEARYPFVTVLVNERNRGLMYSIDRALAAATGDYVVWASADDRLLPAFLERNVEQLCRHPGAGVAFSRLAVFEDGTDIVTELKDGPAFEMGSEPNFLAPHELRERLRYNYLWMSGNTVVVRRDALLAAGAFRPELAWHTEWFVFYLVALRHGACLIPETLALMRQVPNTYSHAGMKSLRRQMGVLRAMVRAIHEPALQDVAQAFRNRPFLLSPFGLPILAVLFLNPRWWPMAWRCLHMIVSSQAGLWQWKAGQMKTRGAIARAKLLTLVTRWVDATTPAAWKE